MRVIPSKCDNLGSCEGACPYGAIASDANDIADKCDFCSHRLDANMEPACVETCPAEVFHFGDANDPASPYTKFMTKNKGKTTVLKPEENTKPSVNYKGHVVAMESKIPKGNRHDPYSYEIETWTSTESQFPKKQRVLWAKPASPHASNVTVPAAPKAPPAKKV